MNKILTIIVMAVMALCASAQNPYQGKHAAYLGDSMTDPRNSSANHKYWKCLKEDLGLEPHVFAVSGYEWNRMDDMARKMADSLGREVDVIFIWCGTNDYNHSVPVGEFFTEKYDTVNVNGQMLQRKHRTHVMDESTLCGRMNLTLSYLKSNYPDKEIYILTPIHRGYAKFNDRNVQPDENYANGQGLYIEDYVDVIKRGAALWSVPVIDLYAESGIVPNLESNDPYISKPETDRLHPNNAGHRRIADRILRTLAPTRQ